MANKLTDQELKAKLIAKTQHESKTSQFPTEIVPLPSKGLVYPKDHPLSSGEVELKYMTAKEEDILASQNLIRKGVVLDKLFESVVVSKDVNIGDIFIGDKNAILLATRILGYGKDYSFTLDGEEQTVDLTEVNDKELQEENLLEKGKNEFTFKLPSSGNEITFRLLTHKEEKLIDREIAGLKKINKDASPEVTTRLKQIITSVNGIRETKDIRDFVDNYLLAKDARALRAEYTRLQPDVDMKVTIDDGAGGEEVIDLPIGLGFFWPDSVG